MWVYVGRYSMYMHYMSASMHVYISMYTPYTYNLYVRVGKWSTFHKLHSTPFMLQRMLGRSTLYSLRINSRN